ncbi:16227_t:CDS:2 [Acaulospora colombiana]|uniref:16227_t:CDS:1 n=1 Tax=Acaulospora colombiana TaxID=27376 RepID=A0ACA9LN19_9GLOM|nr:16227_t:CDS:2 [Acaulospora colombiana]
MSEIVQNIYIRDTEIRNTPKPHIVYRVEVNTSSRTWSIWKRYSEFDELNDKFVRLFPNNPPPNEMPAKHYFQSTLGNPVLIEERRRGLEDFLRGILFHKDDRWRETDEWKEFLAIPTGRPLDATTMYTSESWLDEYNQVQSMTKEIRSLLNRRETHIISNEVQASHNCGVQAKKSLAALGVRVTQLEGGLTGLAKGMGRDGKIMSEGELRRRQDLLNDLKDEKDTLNKLVMANRPDISKSTTPASSVDRAALFRQPVPRHRSSPQLSGRLGNNVNVLERPPSRRVFGNARAMPEETEVTRGLDNEGLVNLQRQTMEDQEHHVEQFSAILSRHKQIGLAIGQELDIQNQMLSELNVDQTATYANNGHCRNGQYCDYSHIHGQGLDGEESSSTRKTNSPRRSDFNSSPKAQSSNASSTNQFASPHRASNSHYKQHENITICKYFLRNSCIYGDSCWNRHERPEATVENSPYVVPSPTFAKSGPAKDQIISSYRERLAQIPCKYFKETRRCPFADACHYEHANPDGTRCILGPPRKKKTRSVCPIENFRYLEVSGESSVIDISAISEILGGLSRDHGFRNIFARDWGDNWDDKIDFAENPSWDDDFPFEDQIGSFSSDNQEDITENSNNTGWGNSEWGENSGEWWTGWD